MKRYYEVKSINPCNGLTCTYLNVPEDRIRIVDGKQVYYYNDKYNACPIASIKQIPQSYMDAQLAYFDKFGTAAE